MEKMRARSLKPGFFHNETLAELPPLTRIFFAGLWCVADREGRFENRPKRLKAEILPYDHRADVAGMLSALAENGFVILYQIGQLEYGQVVNFSKHQQPHHREKPSDIPPVEQGTAQPQASPGLGPEEARPSRSSSLTPSSLTPSSGAPPNAPPPGGMCESFRSDFELFWKAYPKRTGNKALVFERYKTARKEATAEEVLRGAQNYAAECKADHDGRGREPKFIKWPQGWLSEKRWVLHQELSEEAKANAEVKQFIALAGDKG